ncbi:MAG: hypothetical protein F6K47_13125 [Symploca sp. SIO2E6]|nr:hypothetical protein [Symploca sp. SIO2E6]
MNDVKFTPKGNLIVSASNDQTVKIWKLDGTIVKDFNIYNPYSINFSSDGKILAVTSKYNEEKNAGRVAFWLIEGMFEKYVNFGYTFDRHVSFSPDGKAIAFATSEGLLLKSLELDKLLQEGCDKVRGYLKNNPKVEERDRKLCDDIGTKE